MPCNNGDKHVYSPESHRCVVCGVEKKHMHGCPTCWRSYRRKEDCKGYEEKCPNPKCGDKLDCNK